MDSSLFIHIGYGRSGSTWLQEVFKRDERIHLLLKPGFFKADDLYQRGPAYYQDLLQANHDRTVTIDSDESYSLGRIIFGNYDAWQTHYATLKPEDYVRCDIEELAGRMRAVAPNALILMILRNQIDWLGSFYRHSIRSRRLSVDFRNYYRRHPVGRQFWDAARYDRTVETFQNAFGKEHVKVICFQRLKDNPKAFLTTVYNLLGLPPPELSASDMGSLKKHTMPPDGQLVIQRFCNRYGLNPEWSRRIHHRLPNALKKYPGSRIGPSPMEKARIRKVFESSNRHLKQLCGIEFDNMRVSSA
jgi:hypothetical protein